MIQRETGDIPDEYRLWQPKPMARGQLYENSLQLKH